MDVGLRKSRGAIAYWAIEQVVGQGDAEVQRLAGAQRGMVHRDQLVAASLGRGAIEHRMASGWLAPVHPGVYLVGHAALAPWAMEQAAVVYYRGRAVLSHRSAAAIWEFAERLPHEVEVTIVGGYHRARPGVRLTHASTLDPRDVRRHNGLPVTAPARTMIDVAGCCDSGATERALAELRVLKLARDPELYAAMARCPSRKGVAQLRALLAGEAETGFTRRGAERRMRALVKRAQLPTPWFNTWLFGYECDAVWPAAKLVVEVDGYAVHGHRAAFENDRRRDQTLIAHGYTVVRVTWHQLVNEPMAVITRVAQALALAQARQA